MNYLDNLEPFVAIISAIIAGVFSLIVEFIRQNRSVKDNNSDGTDYFLDANGNKHFIQKNKPKTNFSLIAAFVTLVGLSGYFLTSYFVKNAGNLPESETIIPVITLTQDLPITSMPALTSTQPATPTPIPYGDVVLEINFAQRGEGACNDYDSEKLGYYEKKYYIQPNLNGYIAICHEGNNLIPPGSLQVVAYPETSSSYYGYGLLFGWKGSGTSTTDACIMGIRNFGGRTEAVYVDWVKNNYKISTHALSDIVLDNQPHTLRIVFQPNNVAQGYIDGKFFAEHQFTQCSKGPIGMVAWGVNQKIFFDDLKLFESSK